MSLIFPNQKGYQTAYSQLAYASKQEPDPFKGEIPDAKVFLAKRLEILATELSGKVPVSDWNLFCLALYDIKIISVLEALSND